MGSTNRRCRRYSTADSRTFRAVVSCGSSPTLGQDVEIVIRAKFRRRRADDFESWRPPLRFFRRRNQVKSNSKRHASNHRRRRTYGLKGKARSSLFCQAASGRLGSFGVEVPTPGTPLPIGGEQIFLRQVPSSSDPSTATFCIAAGCVVDEAVILRELDLLNIEQPRIIVDPRAVLVSEQDREAEARELTDIASTCSGTGPSFAGCRAGQMFVL